MEQQRAGKSLDIIGGGLLPVREAAAARGDHRQTVERHAPVGQRLDGVGMGRRCRREGERFPVLDIERQAIAVAAWRADLGRKAVAQLDLAGHRRLTGKMGSG